ncbi:MAG: hypothetical protein ACC630_00950 [Nitrospinota bacterium]
MSPEASSKLIFLLLIIMVSDAWGDVRFVPSVALSEAYDDNIFLWSDREDDFITTISPGIKLLYTTKNSSLSLDYTAGFERFARRSDQNNVRQIAIFDHTSQPLYFLRYGLSDRFSIAPQIAREDELTYDPAGLRTVSARTRTKRTLNNLGAYIESTMGTRFIHRINYSNTIEDVSVEYELDERRNIIENNIAYLTNPGRDNRAYLSYIAGFYIYDRNSENSVRDDRDFDMYRIVLGYTHHFSLSWSADISGGAGGVGLAYPGDIDGDMDYLVSAGMDKSFPDGELSLRYDRNISSGGGFGGAVLSDGVYLTFGHGITGDLSADMRGSYVTNRFKDRGTTVANRNDNDIWSVGSDMRYNISPAWLTTLSYRFILNKFAGEGGLRSDTQFQRMAISFDFPIREWLNIGLNYTYSKNILLGGVSDWLSEYERNRIMLNITVSPSNSP